MPPTIVASFRIDLLSSSRSCLRHIRRTPHLPGKWSTVSHARQLTTGSRELEGDSPQPERPKRRKKHREIRTLDPTKLTPSDYVDFSMHHQPSITIVTRPSKPNDASDPLPQGLITTVSGRVFRGRMFPPNTAGFLYYHTPPYSPPLAGEVRFRITPSPDPASFSEGSDLLMEYGVPWKIPLLYMTGMKSYTGLHRLLLQDGLVTPQLLDIATSAAETLKSSGYGQKIGVSMTALVSSFGRRFNLRVGGYSGCCLTIGTNTVFKKALISFANFIVPVGAVGDIGGSARYFPFEGSMICCFEPSTLPEHAGRRVVVLRVLRLLDSDPIRPVPPPNEHEYPLSALKPREGQLLMTIRRGNLQPWSVDVDRGEIRNVIQVGMGRMLKILYENLELYGSPPEPVF
ncbi:hypothetical protein BD309DRAFT_1003603 [Dichomitus squalens]|uniref:Uncharacterized protein n=1 Tax=Dichomitus squalens TaxID=114155 RepID=A0A4Q9PLG1_9APHY|nr:hypothetical protein BD309DRAFT_1003603 [Dichomitus squalens]TBU55001.1 hypothetical protein BD310DRAFT_934625 [Dichomitus squalens]